MYSTVLLGQQNHHYILSYHLPEPGSLFLVQNRLGQKTQLDASLHGTGFDPPALQGQFIRYDGEITTA